MLRKIENRLKFADEIILMEETQVQYIPSRKSGAGDAKIVDIRRNSHDRP